MTEEGVGQARSRQVSDLDEKLGNRLKRLAVLCMARDCLIIIETTLYNLA